MRVIEIDSTIYTEIDSDTFRTAGGAEISKWERREAVTELRRAERALSRFAGRDLSEYDTAEAYVEALEIRNGWDETLELINTLWPR